MFFSLLRKRAKWMQVESPLEKFVRLVIFIAFIGLVCWGFWANGQRYVKMFNTDARIADELNGLSPEQKEQLRTILTDCEKKFNLNFSVKISQKAVSSSDAKEGEIFLGVCPELRQIVILMPAIWHNTIGPGFIFQLRSEIMPPYFDRGDWQNGIITVLRDLEERFDELARR